MTIETKKQLNQVVFKISGRLDAISAPILENAINDNVEGVNSLLLDFNCLEYISSAGLRVLLGAQKKLQSRCQLKLKNVNDEVMSIFEMTGFADILTII
jgi:anti-sigma B factor antagonist